MRSAVSGVRGALTLLSVAFTAYLAVGALVWTVAPAHPFLQIGAVALYLVTTWLCILWRPSARTHDDAGADGVSPMVQGLLNVRSRLPVWVATLAVAAAVIVPNASWLAARPEARLTDYATWGLGAVGALMAIVIVRRRPWAAWTGVALAAVSAAFWIGVPSALALGVVGAVLWVGAAQLIGVLLARAARDTAQLTGLQRDASEWLAAQEGMRRERRVLVQRALAVAGPVLAHTIEVGGRLDDTERNLARIAEATLRDELRGAALLDDDVRSALARARAGGATASVLDEDGLDGLSAAERAAVHAELATIVGRARSERLYIRTSRHPQIAVTVVGRSTAPDGEETVDLWHEIARGGVAGTEGADRGETASSGPGD